MPGRVSAHLMTYPNRWWIAPDICPVADEHRVAAIQEDAAYAPICQAYDPLVGRRTCPYWYATTSVENSADRVDGSTAFQEAIASGKLQLRLAVLCLGARRNRPPGI